MTSHIITDNYTKLNLYYQYLEIGTDTNINECVVLLSTYQFVAVKSKKNTFLIVKFFLLKSSVAVP